MIKNNIQGTRLFINSSVRYPTKRKICRNEKEYMIGSVITGVTVTNAYRHQYIIDFARAVECAENKKQTFSFSDNHLASGKIQYGIQIEFEISTEKITTACLMLTEHDLHTMMIGVSMIIDII